MSAPTTTPRVRWAAVGAVLILAGVAAYMSYGHLRAVAQGQGEDAAALFPISVDGLIVCASLVLLVQRRSGQPGGALPWAGLLLGIAATIAGNVASAEPTTLARLVACWPPVAFALSYEFLLTLLHPADPRPVAGAAPAAVPVGGAGEPAPTEREIPVPVPPVAVPVPAAFEAAELPTPAGDRRPAGDPPGHPAGDPPPTAATRQPDPAPATTPELTDAQLLEQLHVLLDQAGDRAPGRRVLARELGVTEHRIRRLTNGSAPR